MRNAHTLRAPPVAELVSIRYSVASSGDSARPFGSRVDRHAHIGQGHLGLEPFRRLVNDPRFHDHPMILETEKKSDDNEDMDASRGVMGTAVVFGMTIATFVGIFLIPVCYVFIQGLAEFRKKPAETVPVPARPTAVHS